MIGEIAVLLGLSLFALCLAIFAFVFWIWMLVDCLSRKKLKNRLAWVLVLIFLGFIGAVVYYVLVKSKEEE